jgi:probable rRNA maturation factor
MFTIDIISPPDTFAIDIHTSQYIAQLVGTHVDISQVGIVNIAFLPDTHIAELNLAHRGKAGTTDVLSFHYYTDYRECGEDMIAGEVVMSESRILAQAAEYGHSPQHEYIVLLVHSLLHLLGYDHETDTQYVDMHRREEEILGNYKL